MFSTGVGLVLKGFEYSEKYNQRESSVSVVIKKKRPGLLDRILNVTKEIFEEDERL